MSEIKQLAYKNQDTILKIMGFILIVVLASVLRFWSITSYPPGFSADEATIGYNAYSILKTGKDEYGKWFPLAFKAFSDYQAPLYTYVAVPFVAILGLNELAVRLPGALFGILTIMVVYFLVAKLFKNFKIGLFAAFFLAISPWHIFFSRGAWQANLATFWITLGIYLFVLGLEKGKFLPLAIVTFLASLYSYQSPRLIVPLFGIFLLVFYGKELFKKKQALITASIVGLIFFLPLIFILTGAAGQARFKGVSIFTDPGPINRINQERGEHANSQGVVARIFHNKLSTFTIVMAENYLEHFGPKFLFLKGDPIGRQNIPDTGVMYLFDIIFLPLGLFFTLQRTHFGQSKIILLWLAVAPIASALTFQTPNALRAANMAVPLSIISSFGAFFLFANLSKRGVYIKFFGFLLAVVVISFFVTRQLHQYYIHLPKQHGLVWEYGFDQMITFVWENQDKYKKVVITNRYDQPYILTLFYLKYDPKLYQMQPKTQSEIDVFGFTTITAFDKYEFRPIRPEEIEANKNILFVGTAKEIPENISVVKTINFPNGQPAFKIVET
jgi:4-amino-4-deoxy-L-arabinose transferase-like glycosyltransferase